MDCQHSTKQIQTDYVTYFLLPIRYLDRNLQELDAFHLYPNYDRSWLQNSYQGHESSNKMLCNISSWLICQIYQVIPNHNQGPAAEWDINRYIRSGQTNSAGDFCSHREIRALVTST